jgi:hypothetical protein
MPASASEHLEHAPGAAHTVSMPLFHSLGLAAEIRAAAEMAQPADFIGKLIATVPFAIALETEELSAAFLESLRAAEIAAESVLEAEPLAEESSFPFAERMAALPKISAHDAAFVLRGSLPEPQQIISKAQSAQCDARFASPAVGAITTLEPLAFTNTLRALAAGAGAGGDLHVHPIELTTGAPSINLSLTATAPEMQLASGNGYSVLNGTGAAPVKLNVASAPSAQALELRSETSSPALRVASSFLELSLRAAPGCRYNVQIQPGTVQQSGAAQRSEAANEISMVPETARDLATQSLELGLGIAGPCEFSVPSAPGTTLPAGSTEALAAHNDLRIGALPDGLGRRALNPAMAGIRPLAFTPTACAPSAPRPDFRGVAQIYASNAPMNRAAKWEPLDGSVTPQRQGFLAIFGGGPDSKHSLTHLADFWQHAPRDLKLLAIAIPILLGLTLRPSLPKVRVTAPASTGGISKNLGDGFRAQYVNVRNSVAQRAAVVLNEDFRSGLDEWKTRGDLSTGWAFDENGFVKPGTLALYQPSLGLRDYDMEFLGLVDTKALSWVVRAKDFDNYYVVKLVVTKAGPLPTMGITRYAVINGKAQPSVSRVAAINARPDMLYRVTMNVHDDTFLLSMQDTVVDNWTEPRLKRGGVGFFASRGEESRLRWLNITHQYDMLGRLCAYLAPYNIPTTDGSW